MKPKDVQIYDISDFKSGTRLERIYMSMMDDRLDLTETETDYLNEIKHVFSVLQDNRYTQMEATKILQEYFGYHVTKIYRLMNDAEELFSNIRSFNKDFHRIKMREWLVERRHKCSEHEELIPVDVYEKMQEDLRQDLKNENPDISDEEVKKKVDKLSRTRPNRWFNPELAVKINEQLIKLDQLHVPDPEGSFDWESLQPVKPVYVSDPKALITDADR